MGLSVGSRMTFQGSPRGPRSPRKYQVFLTACKGKERAPGSRASFTHAARGLALARSSAAIDPLGDLCPDQRGISTHVDGCQLAAGPAAEPDSVITASPSGSARNLSVMRPASVKSSAS